MLRAVVGRGRRMDAEAGLGAGEPPRGPEAVSAAVPSPLGPLTLAATGHGLAAVLWDGEDPRRVPLRIVERDDDHAVLREAGGSSPPISPAGSGPSTCRSTRTAPRSRSGFGPSCC